MDHPYLSSDEARYAFIVLCREAKKRSFLDRGVPVFTGLGPAAYPGLTTAKGTQSVTMFPPDAAAGATISFGPIPVSRARWSAFREGVLAAIPLTTFEHVTRGFGRAAATGLVNTNGETTGRRRVMHFDERLNRRDESWSQVPLGPSSAGPDARPTSADDDPEQWLAGTAHESEILLFPDQRYRWESNASGDAMGLFWLSTHAPFDFDFQYDGPFAFHGDVAREVASSARQVLEG